jgi:hypothetical protein
LSYFALKHLFYSETFDLQDVVCNLKNIYNEVDKTKINVKENDNDDEEDVSIANTPEIIDDEEEIEENLLEKVNDELDFLYDHTYSLSKNFIIVPFLIFKLIDKDLYCCNLFFNKNTSFVSNYFFFYLFMLKSNIICLNNVSSIQRLIKLTSRDFNFSRKAVILLRRKYLKSF